MIKGRTIPAVARSLWHQLRFASSPPLRSLKHSLIPPSFAVPGSWDVLPCGFCWLWSIKALTGNTFVAGVVPHPTCDHTITAFQVDEALQIKNTDIAKELCLPPVKLHCSSE